MAQQHGPAASTDDVDLDPELLRWLEADVAAAFDFLVAHADDCPVGSEVVECLAGQRRRPRRADRIAG